MKKLNLMHSIFTKSAEIVVVAFPVLTSKKVGVYSVRVKVSHSEHTVTLKRLEQHT